MIGSLRGELLDKDVDGEALVEVAGIGYRISVTLSTLAALPDLGHQAFLHVHHHIREDHQQLYGFPSADERRCFEILISAHGVGPALALAVMSTHPPTELRYAVATEDVDALCLVPGVGKKTAQRLVLELKNKLELPDLGAGAAPVSVAGSHGVAGPLADVRDALMGMGFTSDEAKRAMADLPAATDESDTATLLREALQRLAAR
ncbi:MAG: Holliday junction DNA helicase RuvA [Candidatus Poriferisodalaceae bacterium]|jgi:holliday junction DNA helicase RuvA